MRLDLTSRRVIRGVAPRRDASRASGKPSVQGPRIAAFDGAPGNGDAAGHRGSFGDGVCPGLAAPTALGDPRPVARDGLRCTVLGERERRDAGVLPPERLLRGPALRDVRGPDEFVRDRGRRIVGPFLLGAATILPPSLVVWALGWLVNGRCTPRELLGMKFLDEIIKYNLVGPAHLWFLEYLILMLAAYWAVRAARRGSAAIGGLAAIFGGRLAPVLLAVPTALILWAGHAWLGLDSVADLRNSFLPDPFRRAHHAWFFVVGVALSRRRHDLDASFSGAGWWLGLSALAFLVRAWLLGQDLLNPLHGAPPWRWPSRGAVRMARVLRPDGVVPPVALGPPALGPLALRKLLLDLLGPLSRSLAWQVALEGRPSRAGRSSPWSWPLPCFVGLASDRVLVARGPGSAAGSMDRQGPATRRSRGPRATRRLVRRDRSV